MTVRARRFGPLAVVSSFGHLSLGVALVVAIGTGVSGCSGAGGSISETVRARFEEPAAEEASARAPELYRLAEEARQAAQAAENRGAIDEAEDHATRARLLLDAAIAETQRLTLEEQRLELETQTIEVEEQLALAERAERVTRVAAMRSEAQQVASEQARAAFEQAVVDEDRRYRSQASERTRMHREAAQVLRRRAILYLAAARAMGAPAASLVPAQAKIDASAGETDPTMQMQNADEAVRLAFGALGRARARTEGPTPGELSALRQAATEYSFEVQERPEATTVRLEGLLRGTRLTPNAAEHLTRLAALVRAHPHGAVQVVVHGPAGETLAPLVSEALGESERTTVIAGEPTAEPAIEARFIAYVSASIP